MDKNRAIELLKQALSRTSHLRELKYDNQEFTLWKNEICDILEVEFGKNSTEYGRFAMAVTVYWGRDDAERQEAYNSYLNSYETALKSTIHKYEELGVKTKSATMAEPPKAFIAHGGDSPALSKLKSFLEALGVEPLVVEEQPSEGRSVAENVDWYSRQADCAIILATKGDIDGKTGSFIPRGNVLMEIGKLQAIFKDRIIYLLQAETKFPTNISEKVRERFTSSQMDNAFIKIAKELKKFGILKAVKP